MTGDTDTYIPYARHEIDDADIAALATALRSGVLTSGPLVAQFESEFSAFCRSPSAVASSSGTAAIVLALKALGVGPGDTVIVPAITFAATASAAISIGAGVRFCDVDPTNALATTDTLSAALTEAREAGERVVAAMVVHMNGWLADMPAIRNWAQKEGLLIVEDACHALGGLYRADGESVTVGSCRHSDAACFSFHPSKTMTTGEGGMTVFRDLDAARRAKRLRHHGAMHAAPGGGMGNRDEAVAVDGVQPDVPWYYCVGEAGFNFRMTEMQAALGLSQLNRLPAFIERRRLLKEEYDRAFSNLAPSAETVPGGSMQCEPCLHLYTLLLDIPGGDEARADIVRHMAKSGVGSQVLYIPLTRQPAFRKYVPDGRSGRFAGADAYYGRALSIPYYPSLTEEEQEKVIRVVREAIVRKEERC